MLGCSQSSGRLQCIKSKMLHGSRASSLQKSYTALLLETLRFGQILCIGKRNAYKQQVLSQRSILMWFFMGLFDFPEKDAFISYYQVCIPGCQLFFFSPSAVEWCQSSHHIICRFNHIDFGIAVPLSTHLLGPLSLELL